MRVGNYGAIGAFPYSIYPLLELWRRPSQPVRHAYDAALLGEDGYLRWLSSTAHIKMTLVKGYLTEWAMC